MFNALCYQTDDYHRCLQSLDSIAGLVESECEAEKIRR